MKKTMGEMMAEDEARMLAEAKIEIAREDAAWAALSAEEQAAEIDKADQKWAALMATDDEDQDEKEEDDDE